MNNNFRKGFIIGSVIGDGNISIRNKSFQIEIEQKNKEWLEILNHHFNSVFGKYGNIRERKDRKTFRLRICSKKIVKFVQNDIKNLESNLKKSSEFERGFLRGLFDSEGSVHKNKNRITVSNKNSKIIMVVKKSLEKFDIKTGSCWENSNGVIVVPINGKKNLVLFNDKIGFSHPEKMKRLKEKLQSGP